jgi:hypothetical protein
MSADIIALTASLILAIPVYLWTSLAAVAVFRKAGVETWPAWIPVYNVWVLCSLAGVAPWLALLCLVPPFIPIVFLVIGIQLSPRFGLSPAWCALAAVCPPAYLTVLGWGSAHWDGPTRQQHAPATGMPSPRPDLDWLSSPQQASWNGVSDATEIAAPAAPILGESVSDTVRADLPATSWAPHAAPTASTPVSPLASTPSAFPPAPPLSVSLPDPIEAEQTPDWRNLFASSADVPGASTGPDPAPQVPASLTEAPYVPEPAAPAADPYGAATAVPGLAPTFYEYTGGANGTTPVVPEPAPAEPAAPWQLGQPAADHPVPASSPAAAPWNPPAAGVPAPAADAPAPAAGVPMPAADTPAPAWNPAAAGIPAPAADLPVADSDAVAQPGFTSAAPPIVPPASPVAPVVAPEPPATPGGATRMREDSEVVAEARASAAPHAGATPQTDQPVPDPDEPYRPIVIPGPPAPPVADAAFAPVVRRNDPPSELSESVLDYSQEVSAVVGAPDAGAPRAARESVSAQAHEFAAALDDGDDFEATQLASRRRPVWSLTPPLGGEILLTAEAVVLGRRPAESDERIQNVPVADGTRTVSKTHARLDLIDGVWWITDLASTNGVFLIDESGAEQELRSGIPAVLTERFLLGDAELRIIRATA